MFYRKRGAKFHLRENKIGVTKQEPKSGGTFNLMNTMTESTRVTKEAKRSLTRN